MDPASPSPPPEPPSEVARAVALEPADPLSVLNQAFRDAYAARRDAVLSRMGPVIAQIDDVLILRKGGQRFEAPARTRRYHAYKVVTHVPLALYVLLAQQPEALDEDTRVRLRTLRGLITASRDGFEARGLPAEALGRQHRVLDASLALVDDVLRAGRVAREDLATFIHAQVPDLLKNAEDAARDQIETMHASVEAWKRQMTPDERGQLRAVVAASHMSRPGNVATQYFTLTLGEHWEGRFHEESQHPGKRVLSSEATFDEAAAFSLLATHVLDARTSSGIFGEETRMARDLLADAAERILAEMFKKAPEPEPS
ncbi:hypothetical protein G4177_25445 [Corallococcus sp. ZKHCc1 1396]|uniref:Uncharacterized protein n=2 Tax=Corallococcus soli TaxID=2710757 RepID=A0ABR9PUR3_9BACT|nr:hypothetical protein [Corallococcus soli]MBE4751522.1 hypothetical protein [Corallococcus soli]